MGRHDRISRSARPQRIWDLLFGNAVTASRGARAEKEALPRVAAAREAMPALVTGLLDRGQVRLRRD